MDSTKLGLLEELLEHLSGSQGRDLKSLLEEEKKPKLGDEIPSDESSSMNEMEDPKGLSIEKVEVLGNEDDKLSNEDEPNEEELKELIKKYLD